MTSATSTTALAAAAANSSMVSAAHEVAAMGCKAQLSISIVNYLSTTLTAKYWAGTAGSAAFACSDSSSTTYNAGRGSSNGKAQNICSVSILTGMIMEFSVWNSDGGGGICNGAVGWLTLEPEASYENTTGLHEVVVYYSMPGGNSDGVYTAEFVSGTYTKDLIARYGSCGGSTCQYGDKKGKSGPIRTYYCPDMAECNSAGTDRNQMYCGTDHTLLKDACPTVPVTTSNDMNYEWYQGTLNGDTSGRHQSPYIQLQEKQIDSDVPVYFESYHGAWAPVGQHIGSSTLNFGTSWSGSDAQTITKAWQTGLTLSSTQTFANVALSQDVSETQTHSSVSTTTQTMGGTKTLSCESIDCSNGVLYQWQVRATGAYWSLEASSVSLVPCDRKSR